MVADYRDDRTMRYDFQPFTGRAAFMRWWVRDGKLTLENSTRNSVPYLLHKHVLKQPTRQDTYQIRFEKNGEVTVIMKDINKTLIRWDGKHSKEMQPEK